MEKIDYGNPKTREELATQYQPLVHKISNQWIGRLPLDYNDIVGFAEEGLVTAFNSYNPEKEGKNGKTKQSFRQYAAWCILHAILNGANNEGHTVKFSSYLQNKRKKEGMSTYIMRSLDCQSCDEEGNLKMDIPDEMGGIDTDGMFIDDSSAMKKLYRKIEDKFCKRDCDIFYSSFGLKDRKMLMGKDLANKYKIAPCTITFTVKKMVKYIKKDEELCGTLWEILNK